MSKYLDGDECERYLDSDDPLGDLTLTVRQGHEVMDALLSVGHGLGMTRHLMGISEGDLQPRLDDLHAAYTAVKAAIHRQMHVRQGISCLDADDISVCLGTRNPNDPFDGEGWARVNLGDHRA